MSSGRIVRPDHLNQKRSLPIVGSIKVGEKIINQNGKEIPQSLDYFKATGRYASHFHKACGDKPHTINIVFISDEFKDSCFEEWDARDQQGRKAGFGDGQLWHLWNSSKKDYVMVDVSVKDKITEEQRLKWSMTITLFFIIPAINGLVALWSFQTKGKASSIPQIRDTFDFIYNQAGTVKFIPFELTVKKVKSQKPGAATTFHVVSLIPHISQDNILKVKNMLSSGIDLSRIGLLTNENLNSTKELSAHVEYAEIISDIDEEIAACDTLASLKALASGYPDADQELKNKFRKRYNEIQSSETT